MVSVVLPMTEYPYHPRQRFQPLAPYTILPRWVQVVKRVLVTMRQDAASKVASTAKAVEPKPIISENAVVDDEVVFVIMDVVATKTSGVEYTVLVLVPALVMSLMMMVVRLAPPDAIRMVMMAMMMMLLLMDDPS